MTQSTHFPVQTEKLGHYLRVSNVLAWFGFAMAVLAPILPIYLFKDKGDAFFLTLVRISIGAFPFFFLYLNWYIKRYLLTVEYGLKGDTLRIQQGVFKKNHKTIPVDKISDLSLTQGALMRRFGLWHLNVHTIGQAHGCACGMCGCGVGPVGTLYGIADPKFVRETILSARDGSVATF